jgi:hypothetical protein
MVGNCGTVHLLGQRYKTAAQRPGPKQFGPGLCVFGLTSLPGELFESGMEFPASGRRGFGFARVVKDARAQEPWQTL